jgi:hypothetical protein
LLSGEDDFEDFELLSEEAEELSEEDSDEAEKEHPAESAIIAISRAAHCVFMGHRMVQSDPQCP